MKVDYYMKSKKLHKEINERSISASDIIELIAVLAGYGFLMYLDFKIAVCVFLIHFSINLGNRKNED